MTTAVRKDVIALYVNRSLQQWVARDADGNFWIVPSVEEPWDHRQPLEPGDETDLEPVPGHYKYLLGLPD